MSDDSLNLKRRGVLGGITALAVGGAGLGALSSSASAGESSLSITTSDVRVENDRGDLSTVSVDPTFDISWEGFDQAVGEVTFSILAKGPQQDEYTPLFRTAPWLIPDSVGGSTPAKKNGWRDEDEPPMTYSKPGTSGSIQFNDPLSTVITKSAKARGNDPGPVADNNGVTVAADSAPDYQSYIDQQGLDSNDINQYLSGNEVGDTPSKLKRAGATLANGTYGAGFDTDAFDNT